MDSLPSGSVKRIVRSDQRAIVNKRKFPKMGCLKIAPHGVVRGDFIFQFGHDACSLLAL
jgi:hypothetical protein